MRFSIYLYFFSAMIAMQYSLNQDEWVSTALSSMIDDDQLGANLKSATSSCEVNYFFYFHYSIKSFRIKRKLWKMPFGSFREIYEEFKIKCEARFWSWFARVLFIYCQNIRNDKVRTFWKGHKNLKQSPTWFDIYLVDCFKICGLLRKSEL